jgi:hypothetical protein
VSVKFVPQTAHIGDFNRDCAKKGKEKVENDDVTLFFTFLRLLID